MVSDGPYLKCLCTLQASKLAVSATQKTKELTHAVNEKVSDFPLCRMFLEASFLISVILQFCCCRYCLFVSLFCVIHTFLSLFHSIIGDGALF